MTKHSSDKQVPVVTGDQAQLSAADIRSTLHSIVTRDPALACVIGDELIERSRGIINGTRGDEEQLSTSEWVSLAFHRTFGGGGA